MLSREEVIHLLRDEHPYLVAQFGVKRIGLFGSFARGEPREESDIDVYVEFESSIGLKFIGFAEYLEQLLGRKVDILTPAGIQGITIARVAKAIRDSIIYV